MKIDELRRSRFLLSCLFSLEHTVKVKSCYSYYCFISYFLCVNKRTPEREREKKDANKILWFILVNKTGKTAIERYTMKCQLIFFVIWKKKYRIVFYIFHSTVLFSSQRLTLWFTFLSVCIFCSFSIEDSTTSLLLLLLFVCSDVRKIEDKCRLFIRDYILYKFSVHSFVYMLTVCLQKTNISLNCVKNCAPARKYDRQIETSNASSKQTSPCLFLSAMVATSIGDQAES